MSFKRTVLSRLYHFTFFLIFFLFFSAKAYAITWDGGGADNNWSTPENWDTDMIPTAGDDVIFNGTSSKNSTIDTDFTITSLAIEVGYAGTITGTSNNLTILTGFTLSAGTFTAPSGTMSIDSDFIHNGGTFNHNSGTVSFDGGPTTVTISAMSETFNNLTINKSGNPLNLGAGKTLIVLGTLRLQDGSFDGAGTIEAQNGITVDSTFDGGSGTVSATQNVSRTITFPAGATLPKFSVASSATGTTLTTSGSGTVTFNTLTLNTGTFNGGSVNLTTQTTLTLGGGDLNTGSGNLTVTTNYSQSGATSDFNGGTGTHSIAGSATISDGTFSLASNSNTTTITSLSISETTSTTFTGGTGNITLLSNFSLASGTFNAPSGNFTIPGDYSHTGGTFNNNSGTVIFGNGTTNVTLTPATETFNNLTINKDGNVLTLGAGKTFIVSGTLLLQDGLFDGAGTIQALGNVTVSPTFDGGTGTLLFSGSASQTFDLTGATTLFDGPVAVDKSGGEVNLASSFTVETGRSLTLTEGTFDLNGNNLTTTGATFTVEDGGNLQLQGGETVTGDPTLNAGSTVTYNGAAASYTLKNYSYSNLTVAGGASSVFTLPGNLTGIATTTLTTGILSLNGSNISLTTLINDSTFRLQGGETVTITGGMDTNSGIVEYVGTGTYASLAAGNSYYNLTFNGTGGSWTHTGTLDVNSNLTLTLGTLISGGQNIMIAGDWSNAGTYTSGSNTVTFDGSGAQSLTTGGTGTGQDFNNLTINKSAGTLSLSTNALDVDGTLTVSSGTFSSGALATVAATLTVNGGTFTQGAGTITVSGTTTVSSGILTQGGSISTNALTVSGGTFNGGTSTTLSVTAATTLSSGTFTQNTTALTTSDLTVNGGTLTGGSATIDVNDDFTLSSGALTSSSGNLTIAGDFIHSGGTFTHNSGTVTLDGTAQTLSSSATTTFNNLTKTVSSADTLTLTASTTNIISGTLNLQGASGNLLSLRSSLSGTQASLNPQGTRTVQYLDVKDNNNINSTAILCTTGCTDSGNNTNWSFVSSVTANAGPDRTVTTNSSINLNGSGSTGTSLVYSWEITSTTGPGGIAQAGSLTNPTSVTPTFNAPSTAQSVTITLTVTSSAGSVTPSTDTVVMTVLSANNVSKQLSSTTIVGTMNGITTIQEVAHTLSDWQQTVALTFNNNFSAILPVENSGYTFSLTSNNQVVIGLPNYSSGTGEVCLSTLPVTSLSGFVDLNQSNPSNFVCINGAQSNGLFGQYVGVGDLNGDGIDEILISAPGQGDYGTGYIYNSPPSDPNPTVQATILGESGYSVSSILTGSYINLSTQSILFGPANPSMNPNLAFNLSVSRTSQAFFLGSNSGVSGTIALSGATINGATGDLSTLPPPAPPEGSPDPNNIGVSYSSMALGDVNDDGNTDLILVSTNTVYIFFGRQTVDTTLDITDADVVITGGSAADSFGQMTVTGDVTGDGVNDIIIGAPTYGDNDTGAIYIIFGSTSWEASMTLSNAQVMLVTGDNPGDQIGSDLLIFDSTGDGISEIYTPRANGSILVINLFPSASTPNPEVTAGGGCSMTSDYSSDPTIFYLLLYLVCLFIAAKSAFYRYSLSL